VPWLLDCVAGIMLKYPVHVSAVGHNLRLVLAWLRMLLRLILGALVRAFAVPQPLNSASYGRLKSYIKHINEKADALFLILNLRVAIKVVMRRSHKIYRRGRNCIV
jgi:hypothetical protein